MQKITNNFSLRIAGAAGDGILNAGLQMFAKACVRGGLDVFAYSEYPSLIRGGHDYLDVRVSDAPVHSHSETINLLVALNAEAIEKHANKISEGGGLIYDSEKNAANIVVGNGIKKFPIPLAKIAEECGGQIMRNTVAIGAVFALTGFDAELLYDAIKNIFSSKGEKIVQQNMRAAKTGFDFVKQNFKNSFSYSIEKKRDNGNIFLSGNEAIALGAIKAGCKFFAAYPMTPASNILHAMAALEKDYILVVKHTEDEIAAINMIIGAGFTGVRAMTATSGGGFALMTEGLGLAAQTETPIVIVEVQRPGPATGMATHTGQGDLRYVLHASTDEFPRVLIAPGDLDECFALTFKAFNLAEKYQMPVIILTDKYLGESYGSTKEFDCRKLKIERGVFMKEKTGEEFKRYEITESGISPRSIPGTKGGEHVASSYEHDECGFECEDGGNRKAMHEKRYRKFDNLAKELPEPELNGNKNADVTIIGWGSTKGPIKEAMKLLTKDGIITNYLQVIFLSPFPAEKVGQIIRNSKKTVLVENNKTAQLGGIIRECTGIEIKNKILKYDGRPFSPDEIYREVKEIAKQ